MSGSRIFISYRHSDSAGHAGRLHDRLQQRYGDHQVFMDLEMEYGIDFVERIDEAVSSSAVMLVMIGPGWLDARNDADARRLDDPSDFVRIEVSRALARETRVIPVLVGKAQMPGSGDLPEPMQALARRNALELSDSRWDYDFGRLVQSVDSVINAPEPIAAADPVAAAVGAPVIAAAVGAPASRDRQPENETSHPVKEPPQPTPPPARVPPPGDSPHPGRQRIAILAGAGAIVVAIVIAVIAISSGGGGGGGGGGAQTSLKTVHLGASAGPGALAVANDTLWVAEKNKGELAEIALPQLTLKHRIALPSGSHPTRVVVDPRGIVWLSDPDNRRLIRVEPSASGGHAREVDLQATPRGLMTTAGEQLLVADSTGGRVIRVTGGGQILQEWTVGGEPRALVAGRPGVLWLSDPNGHRVIRLDTSSGARDPFPTGGAPGELAVDPAEKLWVTDSTDSHVLRIGRKTGQDPLSSHPVGVGHGPVAIAIADGVIWVANAGDGSVTRLSYRAPWHRLGPDTHIGGDLGGIAASGTKAWVTDTRNGTVTQLESSSQ